jgi:hypothetical protein
MLQANITDVENDIRDASDRNLLSITRSIEKKLPDKVTQDALQMLAAEHDVSEISIIDENGIIAVSLNPALIGFDMSSGEQSSEFMVLLDGAKTLVQEFRSISLSSDIYRKYAGVALREGFLQVGHNQNSFYRELQTQAQYAVQNRRIGQDGYVIICDLNGTILSDREDHRGQMLTTVPEINPGECVSVAVYEEPSLLMYAEAEGYYIVAAMSEEEAYLGENASGYMLAFMEVLVFAALFVTIFVEQWLGTKKHGPAIVGVAATVVCLVLFGAEIFLIPSMVIIAISLAIMHKTGKEDSCA